MSDLLRITTPLINRSTSVLQNTGPGTVDTFSIQSAPKVLPTPDQLSETEIQSGVMRELNYTPELLLNMLNDPEVMVSFLKNINVFQELLKLLPADSESVTNETQNIINSLMIKPELLPQEMKNQENAATSFKGEIYEFLRGVSDSNWSKPEVQIAIAKFLQATYNMGKQQEIADSSVNNLSFLKSEFSSDNVLSGKIDELISNFKTQDLQAMFPDLKAQTIQLMKEIVDSSLLTPKSTEIASILIYNLSRYDGETTNITENALNLFPYLTDHEKRQFFGLFESDYSNLREDVFLNRTPFAGEDSKVNSLLAGILSRLTETGKMGVSEMNKLETALHGLLLSPCNFTPLLHFMLPLQQDDMRALAEIWINREANEQEKADSSGEAIHVLMVIDINDVGRFEAEFYVHNSTIDFHLYCPEGSEKDYEELVRGIPKLLYGTEYHLGKTHLATLNKTRALTDVFKSLPHRGVGVNVKV